jgi:hypothetical protein
MKENLIFHISILFDECKITKVGFGYTLQGELSIPDDSLAVMQYRLIQCQGNQPLFCMKRWLFSN